jgi:hypothetical protein
LFQRPDAVPRLPPPVVPFAVRDVGIESLAKSAGCGTGLRAASGNRSAGRIQRGNPGSQPLRAVRARRSDEEKDLMTTAPRWWGFFVAGRRERRFDTFSRHVESSINLCHRYEGHFTAIPFAGPKQYEK